MSSDYRGLLDGEAVYIHSDVVMERSLICALVEATGAQVRNPRFAWRLACPHRIS